MAPFGLKNSHLKMHFAPCFAWCEIWLEVCENGTRVPGGDFARCENFRTLNSGVRKLHLGNSHFEQWFSHLEINFALCEILHLVSYGAKFGLKCAKMALVCQERISHGAKIFAP